MARPSVVAGLRVTLDRKTISRLTALRGFGRKLELRDPAAAKDGPLRLALDA